MSPADRRAILLAELHDAERTLCQPEPSARYAAESGIRRAIEHCEALGDDYWVARLRTIRDLLMWRNQKHIREWGIQNDDRALRYHVAARISALLWGMPVSED